MARNVTLYAVNIHQKWSLPKASLNILAGTHQFQAKKKRDQPGEQE